MFSPNKLFCPRKKSATIQYRCFILIWPSPSREIRKIPKVSLKKKKIGKSYTKYFNRMILHGVKLKTHQTNNKESKCFGRSFPELTVILFFVGKFAPCSTVILSIIRRLLADNLWRLKSLNKIPQNLQTIAVTYVLQDCQRSAVTKDERKL